jgi:hypothetical protein
MINNFSYIKNFYNFIIEHIFLYYKMFNFIICLDVLNIFSFSTYQDLYYYLFIDLDIIFWSKFYLITLYNFFKLILINLISILYFFNMFNFLLEIFEEIKKDFNYFFYFLFDFLKSFFVKDMILRRFIEIFIFLLFPFFHFFYIFLVFYKYFIKYFIFLCDIIFYWFFIDLKKLYKLFLRIISNNFYDYFDQAFSIYMQKNYMKIFLFIDNKILEKYIDYWLKIYIYLNDFFY